jgi:hypothetical protein
MHKPGGIVEKERLGLGLLHKFDRIQGRLVLGKSIGIQLVRIVLCGGGKPGQAVGFHLGTLTEVGLGKVKPLVHRLRVAVVVKRHVPLANMAGYISIFLEGFGDDHFLHLQPATVPWVHDWMGGLIVWGGRVSAHHMGLLQGGCMAPTHHRTTGGGTGGSRGVSLPKEHSFLAKASILGVSIGVGSSIS